VAQNSLDSETGRETTKERSAFAFGRADEVIEMARECNAVSAVAGRRAARTPEAGEASWVWKSLPCRSGLIFGR
jgi:hypothetical protein